MQQQQQMQMHMQQQQQAAGFMPGHAGLPGGMGPGAAGGPGPGLGQATGPGSMMAQPPPGPPRPGPPPGPAPLPSGTAPHRGSHAGRVPPPGAGPTLGSGGMMGGGVGRGAALPGQRGGGPAGPGFKPSLPPGSNGREVKNDYCQQFVDTGARPQNYLRDSFNTDRFEEYPKLKELITMKDQMANLKTLKLSPETFGTKFDVVLVDPPWDEYVRRAPHTAAMRDASVWTWQEIMALEVEALADRPSFVFLWCGSAEGLDAGRHCLNKWGFKRVEDICWIKTNKERNPRTGYLQAVNQETYSVLTHTKEHCLVGLRGQLKRNLDGHFIHTNCDTDVIVSEEPAGGSCEKPTELYEIIERFCLGKRRLELFGEEHNIRDGWVTVGLNLPASNFRPDVYASHFRMANGQPYVENVTGGRVPRGAPFIIPTPPVSRRPQHHHQQWQRQQQE
ncbi:hypothetical protein QJQ45_003668 [Haematococcus lacustris]|nr:hypothetical protein QJQ45_003668 [Haematococcus lacustris]